MRHVTAQAFLRSFCIAPGFGRQHLNALRQQHSRFTLHLHAVLQVFNGFHTLCQLLLERRQGFTRQRCPSLGGITLPGHGLGHVQGGRRQQGVGFGGPLHGDDFLVLGAADVIHALTHQACHALVANAQFLEHFLQLFVRGLRCEPVTNTGSAVARRSGRERTSSQCIQRMRLRLLRWGQVHFRCIRHFAANKLGVMK